MIVSSARLTTFSASALARSCLNSPVAIPALAIASAIFSVLKFTIFPSRLTIFLNIENIPPFSISENVCFSIYDLSTIFSVLDILYDTRYVGVNTKMLVKFTTKTDTK